MIKRGDMLLIPGRNTLGMVLEKANPTMVLVEVQDENNNNVLLFESEVKEYKEYYDYILEESQKTMKICDETGRQIYV